MPELLVREQEGSPPLERNKNPGRKRGLEGGGGWKSYSEDEASFTVIFRILGDTFKGWARVQRRRGEEGRGWKARGRRETADTDIASRSLFYEQDLPPGPSDCLLSPVSPHTDRFAPPHLRTMHRLLTYACVSITPSCVPPCSLLLLSPSRRYRGLRTPISK